VVKSSDKSYRIEKKRNGRYMVFGRGGNQINAEEKVKILQEAGLTKKLKPKAAAAPEGGETPAT